MMLGEAWFLAIGGIGIAWSTIQLTAIWAAVGPGPYWHRTAASFVAGMVVAAGGAMGILLVAATGHLFDMRFAISFLIAFGWMGPFLWLVGQLPLLPLRYGFGWTIGRVDRSPSIASRSRMTIGDMMLFTAICAVCFGGFQLARGLLSEPSIQFEDFVPLAGYLAAVCFGSMLVFTIPALLLIIKSSERTGCVAVGVLTAVFLCFTFLILAALHGAMAFPFVMMFFVAAAFFLGLPLTFLREAGYVLYIGPVKEHDAPKGVDNLDVSTMLPGIQVKSKDLSGAGSVGMPGSSEHPKTSGDVCSEFKTKDVHPLDEE